MHFAFTEEQAMIAEMARAFFAAEATSERTRAAMATPEGIDGKLWQAFGELGLAGIALPASHGGAGLGALGMAIVAEQAGAHVAALPCIASHIAAEALLAGGTDEQRQAWLPRLASGRAIATFAAAGGIWRDGRFTGLAPLVPHGMAADILVLESDGRALLVEADAPGLSHETQVTMDQTRPLARIRLEAAPAAPLAGDALAAAHRAGAVAIAADALGGAQACLDRTLAHVRERVQFGRPIGSFQAVKHRLADMLVDIEQARSAVWWAACAIDERDRDATLALHAAKAFACDTYARCAAEMIQLHGGIGFTWEHDAHLYFKRARADFGWLGTPGWHREQIARLLPLEQAA